MECFQNGIESSINKNIKVHIDELCCKSEYEVSINKSTTNIAVLIDGNVLSNKMKSTKDQLNIELAYNGICNKEEILSSIELLIKKTCGTHTVTDIITYPIYISNTCKETKDLNINKVKFSSDTCGCFYEIGHNHVSGADRYVYQWSEDDFNIDVRFVEMPVGKTEKKVIQKSQKLNCKCESIETFNENIIQIDTPVYCPSGFILPCSEIKGNSVKVRILALDSSGNEISRSGEKHIEKIIKICGGSEALPDYQITNIEATEKGISVKVNLPRLPDFVYRNLYYKIKGESDFMYERIEGYNLELILKPNKTYEYYIDAYCALNTCAPSELFCSDILEFITSEELPPSSDMEENIQEECGTIKDIEYLKKRDSLDITWENKTNDAYSIEVFESGKWRKEYIGKTDSISFCRRRITLFRLIKLCESGIEIKSKKINVFS